jgi:SAM-dependent methyltransferase
MTFEIANGNTQKGVNKNIIQILQAFAKHQSLMQILDIPCGQGDLARALQVYFPKAAIIGADIATIESTVGNISFFKLDASKPFSAPNGAQFDAILSVSGVMDFDNTGCFIETCSNLTRENGIFIVSNDNIATLRDRLSFLFFGRFRRFRLFVQPGGPTYNPIPLQLLYKILKDKKFDVLSVKYCSAFPEDFLLLPFAAIFYLFQVAYLLKEKSVVPYRERLKLFPWQSMIYRHYIIEARRLKA